MAAAAAAAAEEEENGEGPLKSPKTPRFTDAEKKLELASTFCRLDAFPRDS